MSADPTEYLDALAEQRDDVERLHRTPPPAPDEPKRSRFLTDDERRRGLARIAELRAQLDRIREQRAWH